MTQSASSWVVDPDDPRAPPMEIWERMTPEERQRVADSLPSEIEASEAQPPEGDPHFNAKVGARSTLGGYFSRVGRKVYLACELPVYFPAEAMFAPDVIAVLDVECDERMRWLVAHEGKGPDFALEVYVAGDRRKDLEKNVERFARLGIREYFIFDRGHGRLTGYALPAPGARSYKPIMPQAGRYPSRVLELDLAVEGMRLRFFHGTAPLLEADELIGKLEAMLDDLESRFRAAEERANEEARLRQEATHKLEEETRKLAEEIRKREELERRLAEALAELERRR